MFAVDRGTALPCSDMASRRHLAAAPHLVGASSIAVLLSLSPSTAGAATWSSGNTPTISQIFAIDATGETSWPYGQEDVAGDGLATFAPAEQAMDLRTGYASTDASRFWVRVYVSDPNAVAAALTAYVFVDADQNPATGGSAAATTIDAALTMDPSPGGYEFVIGIHGNGMLAGVWGYQSQPAQYVAVNTTPANARAEAGTDTDPILIDGTAHGYVEASVDLTLVGLTQACSANLFVRSVDDNGAGDLEAGQAAACVAADGDADGVPDFVIPPSCTSDAQCPAGRHCLNGACVANPSCTTDMDCAATDQCTGGHCVARPVGTCASDADCGELICSGGQCVACTPGGTQCGSGRVCATDGRCTDNVVLAPGERVEGGAFHCALARPFTNRSAVGGLLFLAGCTAGIGRHRKRQPRARCCR
jgi:Cys-rich repeat protein